MPQTVSVGICVSGHVHVSHIPGEFSCLVLSVPRLWVHCESDQNKVPTKDE